jgi:hypothetical protein
VLQAGVSDGHQEDRVALVLQVRYPGDLQLRWHEYFVGDLVGWLSVKSTVLKYYASLSVEHAIVIVASLCDIAWASLTTTLFSTRP